MSAAALATAGVVAALALGLGDGSDPRAAAATDTTAGEAGTVLPVTDSATFEQAVASAQPGDTIQLADGTYPVLTVSEKTGLTLAGGRGAAIDGIAVERSANITISGVSIAPSAGARAEIVIGEESSGVTIDGVLIDGRDEAIGAGIVVSEAVAGVTLQNSEITNCGAGSRCLAVTRGAEGIVVSKNAFHDCISCDFIRGGSGMVVRGNTFDRVAPGQCVALGTPCPHNDYIQITGGGPWRIVGNTFGDRQGGAATIYVSPGRENTDNPIRDVKIQSNLFLGTASNYAIKISGGSAADGRIGGISIVNNTILSGDTAALALEPGWTSVPPDQRPLVVNNIFGRLRSSRICERGRFVANLVIRGPRCTGLARGKIVLDSQGAPSSGSSGVIDKGDPAYAPKLDFYGKRRVGKPDVGAIEFRPARG